jgi:uncharacterized protein YcfJ
MTDAPRNPWKLTAIALGLVAVTALVTAAVVADWSGRPAVQTLSEPPGAAVAPAPAPPVPPAPAPGPMPARPAVTVPTQAIVEACNQYATAQVGRRDKTTEVVKDGSVGAVVGAALGAATGAIAGGGKGAGQGAAIGGIVGAGGGTLYGLNDNKKHDQRYRDAYAVCMRGRGFSG